MSNNRIKTDENKIILATSYGFNKTFDVMDGFDFSYYGIYYTKTANLEDIIKDYEKVYQLYKAAYPKQIVTIFDKAICLGYILKRYTTFGSSKTDNIPRRIALLNERYIAEVMVALLHYSEYSVRNQGTGELIPPTQFDLDTLMQGHEDELQKRLVKLTKLLATSEYQANEIHAALKEIYQLAILYGNCFDPEDFAKVSKRIRVKETKTTPHLRVEENILLKSHRESMAGKYHRS